MNRFIVPIAGTVLVAGLAVPGLFPRHSAEPVVTEPPTTIVREIYHEAPVVYVDTVYMPEEPAPVQPVYVEEHNDYEYNQYNETYVDVHQRIVVPPPPQRRERGRSPRERGQEPRDRSGYDRPGTRRDPSPGSNPPNVPVPKPQVKRAYAPVANDRQNVQVPPSPLTPPYQPVQPKRQVPVRGGGTQTAKVQPESPKQAPTPPADKSAASGSENVQASLAQAKRK